MMTRVDEDLDLAKKMLRICGDLRCRCDYEVTPLGRLHGVDMGSDWGRVTTERDCPHHGTKASAERDARHAANNRRRTR